MKQAVHIEKKYHYYGFNKNLMRCEITNTLNAICIKTD